MFKKLIPILIIAILGILDFALIGFAWQNPTQAPPSGNLTLPWIRSGTNVYLTNTSDNVGIGVTNPAIKLAIGDSDTGIQWISDGILGIYTDNAERIRINSAGNVGIGTTNPTNLLTVNGAIRMTSTDDSNKYTDMFVLKGYANETMFYIDPMTSTDTYESVIRMFRNVNTTGVVKIDIFRGNGTIDLNSTLGGNTNTFFNVLVGNVGIGTTAPAQKLDVNGFVKSEGSGFLASISTHATAGSYIVFNQVKFNVGNDYNPTNGRYTAPINGLYQLCWGGIENPNSAVSRSYLHINGSNYYSNATQLRLDGGSDAYDGGSKCVTVYMSASDYAQVYMGESGLYTGYAYFTGHLIVGQ